MTLPALELLANNGHELILVGKAWAADLFGAYPWKAVTLRGTWLERANILRALKKNQGIEQALLFTNSFSSALDFRLAGIAADGYARDGRSWLLSHAIEPIDAHMVEYYWHLATARVKSPPALAENLALAIAPAAQRRAEALIAAAGVSGPYVVVCPVAVGTHHGKVKAWSGYARLSAEIVARGHKLLAVPGPGEADAVAQAAPAATRLPQMDVGSFAAILAGSRLVIANDSGPGHLAAAVGAPLISVFGVTEQEKTRPWSTRATRVGSASKWPTYEEVLAAVDAKLGA